MVIIFHFCESFLILTYKYSWWCGAWINRINLCLKAPEWSFELKHWPLWILVINIEINTICDDIDYKCLIKSQEWIIIWICIKENVFEYWKRKPFTNSTFSIGYSHTSANEQLLRFVQVLKIWCSIQLFLHHLYISWWYFDFGVFYSSIYI